MLLSHPDVTEATVVGVAAGSVGDQVAAVVVLRRDATATADEVRRFVDDQLPEKKRLRGGVHVLDHIPRTHSFKPRKSLLRQIILGSIEA